MGLISLICDCLIISTACAGARRAIGLNIGQKVVGMIKNETGLVVAKGFFNTGEWVADKSINYARNKIFQHKLNEFKDFTNNTTKPNVTNTTGHNTYTHHNHQQQNSTQFMPQNQQPPPQNNSNNTFRH